MSIRRSHGGRRSSRAIRSRAGSGPPSTPGGVRRPPRGLPIGGSWRRCRAKMPAPCGVRGHRVEGRPSFPRTSRRHGLDRRDRRDAAAWRRAASLDSVPDRSVEYPPVDVVRFTARITDNLTVVLPVDGVGATLLLAELYQEAGRIDEAIGLVQQVYEDSPGDAAILLSLADLVRGPRPRRGRPRSPSARQSDDPRPQPPHPRVALLGPAGPTRRR